MMKKFQSVILILLSFVAMTSFSQCSSSKKLQKKPPSEIGQVYCQPWVAGVEGGGSGMNIYIPVTDADIKLDSVYFRGQGAKLEFKAAVKQFVGRFPSDLNRKKDMVMSSDPKDEYGNEMPDIKKPIPFELEKDECVISFEKDGKMKYFKIGNVVEKQLVAFPSAPPVKQ